MRMDDYRRPSEFFESINCSNRCSALSRKQKGVTWEQRCGSKERAEEIIEKIKKSMKILKNLPEVKEQTSKISKEQWKDKKIRRNHIRGIRKVAKEKWEGRSMIERYGKKRAEDIIGRMGENRKGKCMGDDNPSKRPDVIVKLKKAWRKNRDRRVKAIVSGIIKRPTSFEQKLIHLIEVYDLPYRYIGNGDLIIAGKNPDFINTNGEKILIEVYHYYDARKLYEKERYEFFKRFGFHTIFLKDDEILAVDWEEKCLEKIGII